MADSKPLHWLPDENFDNNILRGLRRRNPDYDLVRVQDIPAISGSDDSVMLRWATANDRVVLTHDVSTMVPAIFGQLSRFGYCAPVVFVPKAVPVNVAIDDILLLDRASVADDWATGVIYLPLG